MLVHHGSVFGVYALDAGCVGVCVGHVGEVLLVLKEYLRV